MPVLNKTDMPVTRSFSGQGLKRAASPKLASTPKRTKLPKPSPASTAQPGLPTAVIPSAATKVLPTSATDELAITVPLTLDVDAAKRHLLECDPRWASMFDQLKCRPFEGEDVGAPFNPFRSLATSILGQQVSWLAAKAITYRFCRL